MSKHFQCTTCGKCCYGPVPLTIQDAFSFIHLFPIGFTWRPVQQASKDFPHISKLGVVIASKHLKQKLAVLITPTSFIPKTLPCPALTPQNLCNIHEQKPLRCKNMPFYPYREEKYQNEVLTPKADWECDTSSHAPLIFQNSKVIQRKDYDAEFQEIRNQVPLIKTYADYMLTYSPWLQTTLVTASQKQGSSLVTSLSSFLTATRNKNGKEIAEQQLPVLKHFAELTANNSQLADFHTHYINWAKEWTYLLQVSSRQISLDKTPLEC